MPPRSAYAGYVNPLRLRMEAPYGTWRSPIDGDAVARDRGWTYSLVTVAGGAVYWSEARPLEGGRDAIVVARAGDAPRRRHPRRRFSARTRVHEYGGGAYTVHDGTVYFCHDADQRIYRLAPGAEPEPITPRRRPRYADLRVTPDGRRLVCVRERDGEPEHVNDLVALPTDGSAEPRVIASGHDFYARRASRPTGRRSRGWPGTTRGCRGRARELYVAELADGLPRALVAGGPAEAIVQPEWSPDGVLHYSSDRTGWWNLYRGGRRAGDRARGRDRRPAVGVRRVLVRVPGRRADRLHVLPRRPRPPRGGRATARCATCRSSSRGSSTSPPTASARCSSAPPPRARRGSSPSTSTRGAIEPLSEDDDEDVDAAYVSVPRPLEYPTTGGRPRTRCSIRRTTRTSAAPAGERPPLLVRVHGGPTAHVSAHAVAGDPVLHQPRLRGRRRQLRRQHRLRARVPRPAARPVGRSSTPTTPSTPRSRSPRRARPTATRMAITGGSAGGWTVLCALAFHPDVFARRRRLLRRLRPHRASSTTRTSSSPATTTGSSARGRRRPICGASARRSTTPTRSARR